MFLHLIPHGARDTAITTAAAAAGESREGREGKAGRVQLGQQQAQTTPVASFGH